MEMTLIKIIRNLNCQKNSNLNESINESNMNSNNISIVDSNFSKKKILMIWVVCFDDNWFWDVMSKLLLPQKHLFLLFLLD
jgi:hypothetical protein